MKEHGTGTHKDEKTGEETLYRLWGGEGNYMEISAEELRKFDGYHVEIDRLGKENGCHTCGRYKGEDTPPNANTGNPMVHWVCDHQPPLGIIEADMYHIYPQCHECSNAQRGKSIIYVRSFTKHVGRRPDAKDSILFWGSGRPHRSTANYGSSASSSSSS
jgi:hypothetical protein